MRRRKSFGPVERAARALAAQLVVEVAEDLNASAAHLKACGHKRIRDGGRKDGQRQLDLGEAMASAEMRLRQKANDLTGKWPAPRARRDESVGLFDLEVQQ